ncbi:MAG: hypothetical protein ACIAQU_12560 [Phycisphaerales bacterium JB064]
MAERNRQRGGKRVAFFVTVLVAVAWAGSLAACRDPLITENQLRSPFHRYDRVRNQDADTFVRDEFGRARPNVAARLAPK